MTPKHQFAALLLALTAIARAQDCTATGTVVNALTNQPIPHAQIAVDSPDSRGASTGADGNFTIPRLPCGHLRLAVTAPHLLPARLDQTEFKDIRILLTPESSVTGKITDVNGNPVPGVRLQPYRVLNHDGKRDLLPFDPSREPESSGIYRIPLPPAAYVVCAHSDAVLYPVGGGVQLRYPDTCQPVAIRAGAEQALDFTLIPVPTVHIHGSIGGLPTGVEAIVDLRNPNMVFQRAPPLVTQRASGNQFDLSGVVPGDYTVQVSAIGGERSFFAIEDVTAGSGGIADLRLTALPSVQLTGSVRFVSSSGQPKPNVRVTLSPDSGTLQWDESRDSFAISNVIPRKYRIAASAAPDAYVQSIKLQGRNVLGQEFVLSAPGNLEIVIADDFGTLEGTVSDPDGHPVASWVSLTAEGQPNEFTQSRPDGKIVTRKLSPGHYTAYAVDAPPNGTLTDPDPASGTPVDIQPQASASVTLVKTSPHN